MSKIIDSGTGSASLVGWKQRMTLAMGGIAEVDTWAAVGPGSISLPADHAGAPELTAMRDRDVCVLRSAVLCSMISASAGMQLQHTVPLYAKRQGSGGIVTAIACQATL